MSKHLPKSKHGEGVGGPVQEVVDPNKPSFDPASRITGTDQKVAWLLAMPEGALTEWERNFVIGVYGAERLSRRQHIQVGGIFSRCREAKTSTWVSIPNGVLVEVMDLAGRGTSDFESAMRDCDREMLIAIVHCSPND